MVQLKLGFWGQLPWVLIGLGHASEEQARRRGARALRLHAHAGDNAEHHWLSHFMLDAGSRCRDQLVAF
eukprot:1570792-Alexandrium_andersonii.AAC.1